MTDTQYVHNMQLCFICFIHEFGSILYSCVFLGIEPMTLHVIWIMCCVIMHRTEEAYLKLTFGEILRAGVIMLLININ